MTNNKAVNFDWSSPYKEDDEYTLPVDTLQRSQYAEVLTSYLCERSKDRSYVLNINSQWGSGKTYFIKRWVATLRANFDVVYVDAWKYDYSDDPLLTVISEIRKQVPRLRDKLSKLKVIGAMAKAGLPSLVSGVVKRVSGFDSENAGKNFEAELVASSTEKATEVLLHSFEHQSAAISSFKKYLRELEPENGKVKPFFIFIDELDRCRPTYAIELLETVKHLFDVPEYVFVIATDTEQLAHSVCAIYGQKFEASRYLSRFFDDSYKLPVRDIRPFIESIGLPDLMKGTEHLASPIFEPTSRVNAVCALFRNFDVSLREIQKVIARFQLFVLEVEHKQRAFDPLFTLLALTLGSYETNRQAQIFDKENFFLVEDELRRLNSGDVRVISDEGKICKTSLKSLLQDRAKVLWGDITRETAMAQQQQFLKSNDKYPPDNHSINRHIALLYEPKSRRHLSITEYMTLLDNAALLE
jgi:hypothetical protein